MKLDDEILKEALACNTYEEADAWLNRMIVEVRELTGWSFEETRWTFLFKLGTIAGTLGTAADQEHLRRFFGCKELAERLGYDSDERRTN